ncbi:hypothetical protein GEV33_002954 [Tenebrio molitor]|uniref:Uncharacterized protein n=1 Tax=Tenebrio molitor TaxID=7067 RepID=A0A8J6HTA4_TENMO|nr:hypothetical protein GEV33_002954 [Tenebrio molitor]
MRDSLELFQKSLEEYADTKYVQDRLLDLIESLYKDLEAERNTVMVLQNQIQSLIKQETFGITSKFVTLKAEYAALNQKLAVLKNENEDLHIQLLLKSEESKQVVTEKEQELQTYYLAQIKQKDEQIKQKEQEVEISKAKFKSREQDLYNEIQAVGASSAMEIDQAEENFKKQLGESHKKLKDNMETCHVLRSELMSVKEQFMEYKNTSSQKIAELQRRLRESQNCEARTPEKPKSNKVEFTVNVAEEKISKYQPLEVNCTNLASSEPTNFKKIPIHRGSGRFSYDNSKATNKKNSLPPLINLKDVSKECKPARKKRKLFNPDDLTYLNVNVASNDE